MLDIHPANRAMVVGAVFDGRYAGNMITRPAAEWLRIYGGDPKAGRAIRAARDGGESSFSVPGAVWHMMPAPV